MKIRLTFLFVLFCLSGYSQWMPVANEIKSKNSNDSLRYKFLVADDHGVVWIGSDYGLVKYSNDNRYKPINFPRKITCAASIDSAFWIGAEDGSVFKVNTTAQKITETIRVADSSAISSIHHSGEQIAISTYGEGVYLLNGNSKIHFSETNSLSDNHVYEVVCKNNYLIAATDRGVDAVNRLDKELLRNIPSSITTSLVFFDSVIIASSYRYGLLKINVTNSSQAPLARSSDQLGIRKIKEYRNRIFALAQKGIYEINQIDSLKLRLVINKANILDFIALEEGVMLALCEDGSVVLADLRFSKSLSKSSSNNTALAQNSNQVFTAGDGSVQFWDLNSGVLSNEIFLEGKPVIVSMAATETDLFVGTFNRGIYKYSLNDSQISRIDSSKGLPDNNVLSMSLQGGTLWFTTLSGVSSLSQAGVVAQYAPPKDVTYIYSVFTNDTCVLIGTDGDGLYELSGTSFIEVPFAERLRNETIYDISQDGSGNLWFITKNQGLMRYEPKLDHFTAMNIGADGYFMASGGSGNSALAVGNGWLKYYSENRWITIQNDQIFQKLSGEYINNISYDENKKILFTTGNELYSFSTEYLGLYPRVELESFQANLIERALIANNLGADINHISYSFAPVWYQNVENVKFRYRLRGIDDKWNYSNDNSAVYPNLKYGTYTFEVETGLGSEYYPESQLKHVFTIAKPFYIEWWFILLIALIIIIIVYSLSKWQIERVNRKWLSEKKLVESELAVLRNQVNPHFLFNSLNTLMNLIETKPKVAEEYLQRLSHFYRKILENQDDQVILLHNEIDNLEEYIYLQKQRFGEALILENTLDQELEQTRIPALTLQLLAENAIKHNVVSQSNPLIIRIYNTEKQIVISNIKTPLAQADPGTGTGLENIKGRYKVLFKMPIEIIDNSNEFIIKLPIII